MPSVLSLLFIACLLLFPGVEVIGKKSSRSSTAAPSKGKKKSRGRRRSEGLSIDPIGGLAAVGAKAIKASRRSLKSAVDLLAGKHVSLQQIVGKWRLHQEITLRKGIVVSCPSTFELLKNGTVVTTFEDHVYHSPYVFKERQWPRYCTIQFEARAFKGPGDKEPVVMLYKGYFKRSILNSKVILMRGRVYRTTGKMYALLFMHDQSHSAVDSNSKVNAGSLRRTAGGTGDLRSRVAVFAPHVHASVILSTT